MAATAAPTAASAVADYKLSIGFDLHDSTMAGEAAITIGAGEELVLHTGSLTITGISLKSKAAPQPLTIPQQPVLHIEAAADPRELLVNYTFKASEAGENRIASDGIVLLSGWHPVPARKMRYALTASLPPGFTAISESTVIPLPQQDDTVSATAPHPLYALHFAAGPYVTDQLQVRHGLFAYTLFFAEDRQLAAEYLAKARQYLLRYEKLIGPYPYDAFVIVANRNPTGLGMPGFTLLGQAVLRLPFIKDTSLGHEILHAWFGNSVDVIPGQGNWCEGLTTFLADHAYREDAGEGAAVRKETILNYHSYVNGTNAIALGSFTYAGHNQPMAQARRAVGYGKSALLFHELRELIGKERFADGVRRFYASHRHGAAGWDELRQAFADVAPDHELTTFFTERLTRTDIPSLKVEDIEAGQRQGGNFLRFTLVQETAEPYHLQLPIRIATMAGDQQTTIATSQLRQEVMLPLPALPLGFTLDPEYSLMRQLHQVERPPLWSQILGSDRLLIILESREAQADYRPLLDILANGTSRIAYDGEVLNSDLQGSDLLLLGLGQQSVRSLFARPPLPVDGFTLAVRHNPLNLQRAAALVTAANPMEIKAIASRLVHYGKYSYLHSVGGRMTDKKIDATSQGISSTIEELPSAVASRTVDSFTQTIDQLADHDVIYIGESHTSVSDHRLQLRLIEALAAKIPQLAIGLEMFPDTSQPVLDAYFLGDGGMGEQEFIKKSRYHEVWGYDYRYYRDIFTLAKKLRIPVIGLNLEREIVSTVYRTGATDALDPAVRSRLPAERDLALPGYSKRLISMHALHDQGGHGSGNESGFIQAQAIWDEAMAEAVASFLAANPGHKMVVLAGSEHTRKDSGIPPRVERRLPLRQVVVANVADRSLAGDRTDLADYLFFSLPMELPEPPKMGILLETRSAGGSSYLQISGFSAESKAVAAGLKQGDILRTVGSVPVKDMTDIRIAMINAEALSALEVEVTREVDGKSLPLSYTVPLVHLAPATELPPGHPTTDDDQSPVTPNR